MATNQIKTGSYVNDKQILVAPEQALLIGVVVDNTGVSANDEGKMILAAGTPVGSATDVLLNRDTVLSQDTSTCQGVLLHDVDVTDGEANATLVVKGTVDYEKLNEDVQALVDTASSVLTNITFLSGSKI